MPTCDEVLRELESMGTEQNRKIYRRHGVGENMYGVSYANFGALRKRIKTDQALAQQLWATGNHDARVLATMIADPGAMDAALLDAWAHDLPNHVLADALVTLAAKAPAGRTLMDAWMQSESESIGRAGWHLLGQYAANDPTLPDSFFMPYLQRIARDIHTQTNRVKEAMHNVLMAIGIRNEHLEAEAITVAETIGKVVIDHGETNCKTPDTIPYIRKARDRLHARAAKTAR